MTKIDSNIAPSRVLFAMLRVSNLETSIAFYRDMLGMKVLETETFESARFTAVYMGYGDKDKDTVIELTHNWDNDGYAHGSYFGNITLGVKDVHALEAFLIDNGVKILRPAGELSISPKETGKIYTLAHIADPDGYRIELIQI